ncbi:MAG TPA: hypothetical protein VFN71_05495, partial [Methylomirabilota bacterium]|nr:hypothetical protein [Methylomirabilota bacterium]
TRNARHFLDLAHHAVSHQTPHAGIILCPPSIRGFEVGKIAERLIRVARAYPYGLGPYDVIYLP